MKNRAKEDYESKNEEYRRNVSLVHFLFNVLGTCLPFLLLVVILPAVQRGNELLTPFKKGDFFLYASSFWAATLFLSNEFEKRKRNGTIAIFGQLGWFPIVLSAGLYIALYLSETISLPLIIIFSITLTLSGGFFLYRHIHVMYQDLTSPEENIQERSNDNVAALVGELK